MIPFPHDEFVKEYLPEVCNDYGIATPSVSVHSETREVDVLFVPTNQVSPGEETLGLLGKMLQKTCLLEVYRNPVQSQEIKDCLSKLLDVQKNELRKAKKEKKRLKQSELPQLWILTPTVSSKILSGFNFNADTESIWPLGVYFLSKNWQTGLIAIHQLPENADTLWLRILGRGSTQSKAIEEIKALGENYPHRENILELMYGLLTKLQANQKERQKIESNDEVLIMSLRTVFREKMLEIEQQGVQQGIQQGIQQEASFLVIRQLKRKLGNLAPNLETRLRSLSTQQLEALGEELLDFNLPQDLIDWLNTQT